MWLRLQLSIVYTDNRKENGRVLGLFGKKSPSLFNGTYGRILHSRYMRIQKHFDGSEGNDKPLKYSLAQAGNLSLNQTTS